MGLYTTPPGLFRAVNNFDIDAIETMVKCGMDINSFDDFGQTPFSAMVEAYYDNVAGNDDRGVHERVEFFVPFEDREVDIIPALKRMLALGADINAARLEGDERENALIHAIRAQDVHMVRFLLKRGADPNFIYMENFGRGKMCADTLDEVYEDQHMAFLVLDEKDEHFAVAKRLAKIEALLIEHGAQTEPDDAAKTTLATTHEENPGVEVKYRLHDIGWVECDIRVGEQHASFSMSYIGDSADDLMQVLFALAHEKSDWLECNYEVRDISFDQEGSHITLRLEEIDGKLRVQVWEDNESEQGVYLINKLCSKGRFLYQAVKAYDEMMKKNGFLGYVRSFVNCEPQPELYLALKAHVLHLDGYRTQYVEDDGTYRTSFADELALFEMVM